MTLIEEFKLVHVTALLVVGVGGWLIGMWLSGRKVRMDLDLQKKLHQGRFELQDQQHGVLVDGIEDVRKASDGQYKMLDGSITALQRDVGEIKATVEQLADAGDRVQTADNPGQGVAYRIGPEWFGEGDISGTAYQGMVERFASSKTER